MSRFLLIALAVFCMISCGEDSAEGAKVHFKINGAANDSLMIGYYLGDKQYFIGDKGDNTVIHLDDKGEATYTNDSLKKGLYMVVFPPNNEYGEFIYDGEDLNVTADRSDLMFTMTAKNSLSNELKYDNMQIVKKMSDARQNAGQAEGTADVDAINAEYATFVDKMIAEHPDNLFVRMMSMSKEPEVPAAIEDNKEAAYYYFKDHYLDNVPFDQEWVVRTPLYQRTIDTYLQRLTFPAVDSLKVAADEVIEKSKANEEVYKYTLVNLFNQFASSKRMGYDGVYVHLANKYYLSGDAPWADQENLDRIKANVEQLKTSLVGMPAQNFNVIESTGKEYSLYDVDSKYTVVFFMDPDCDHCQQAADDFKKTREQLPETVTILGVAFNTKMDKLQLVKKERDYFWKMTIPESEELADKLGAQYNITTFPQIYILDADKKIVAKQVMPSQIPAVLQNVELQQQ